MNKCARIILNHVDVCSFLGYYGSTTQRYEIRKEHKAMTSRERVQAVLRREIPDRVPMDLWGTDSRMSTEYYKKAAAYLKYEELGERIRPGSTSEYEDYRIADLIGSDFRHINIGKPDGFKSYTDENGNIIDEWGVGRKWIGIHPSLTRHPLAEATLDDLEHYPWPVMRDPGRVRGLADRAKGWYENTDFAITATSATSGTIFELCQYLRGIEQFLIDLYEDPDFAHALIAKVTGLLIELNTFYLEAVGPYIEWIEFSSDFGAQNAHFLSPALFEEFFMEPHKSLFSACKNTMPDVKIFLHSCGSVRLLMPQFIEMGVEIQSALQPLAAGMDSAELKQAFGDRLIFHGGVDIQQALTGSLTDTEADVKKRIDSFARDGGYILSPSNHFQVDVPLENFFRMYEFGREYGVYPIGESK
ncbi:hypothetical protein D3Z52_22390 [Clostridiaceae bacterium]|nr:hypothetical protein [Clostridiaceae bacterium]